MTKRKNQTRSSTATPVPPPPDPDIVFQQLAVSFQRLADAQPSAPHPDLVNAVNAFCSSTDKAVAFFAFWNAALDHGLPTACIAQNILDEELEKARETGFQEGVAVGYNDGYGSGRNFERDEVVRKGILERTPRVPTTSVACQTDPPPSFRIIKSSSCQTETAPDPSSALATLTPAPVDNTVAVVFPINWADDAADLPIHPSVSPSPESRYPKSSVAEPFRSLRRRRYHVVGGSHPRKRNTPPLAEHSDARYVPPHRRREPLPSHVPHPSRHDFHRYNCCYTGSPFDPRLLHLDYLLRDLGYIHSSSPFSMPRFVPFAPRRGRRDFFGGGTWSRGTGPGPIHH